MVKEVKNVEHYYAAKPKSKPRYGLLHTCLRGRTFEFLTASGVFSKHQIDLGTRLLIESMSLPRKGCILDMGCGYGPVGIAAAIFNPTLYVFLVDINFRAVWLARQNLQRNLVRNAEVRRGCLYAPVEDLAFNCVLSNPPVSAGLETVKAIIVEAPNHMTRQGVLQMVVRSKVGGKRLRMIFEETFGSVEIMARESGYRVLKSQKP
jgi:16S rRNA (guanine1207-N2)-methyltransferase